LAAFTKNLKFKQEHMKMSTLSKTAALAAATLCLAQMSLADGGKTTATVKGVTSQGTVECSGKCDGGKGTSGPKGVIVSEEMTEI
jgi:hypothetical protein